MSIISRHPRTAVVGAACALAAGGIGVAANAGASTTQGHSAQHHRAARVGRLVRLERRAVHAQLTVPTKAGFKTVTIDRGTVDSVSGNTLTMTEGRRQSDGKQVTLTIPAAANVRNDRHVASLSALTAGERMLVVSLPNHTAVRAHQTKSR